jgi:hypothetical protein
MKIIDKPQAKDYDGGLIEALEPKGFASGMLEGVSKKRLEKRILGGFCHLRRDIISGRLTFDGAADSIIDSERERVERKTGEKLPHSRFEEAGNIAADIVDCLESLSQNAGMPAALDVAGRVKGLMRLKAIDERVRTLKKAETNPPESFLGRYAVGLADIPEEGVGARLSDYFGRVKTKSVRAGLGVGIAVAAGVAAITFAPHLRESKGPYPLAYYQQHSPKTYAKLEPHFENSPARFEAALNWLDKYDGDSYDGRVTTYVTGKQINDLKNVITPEYDMGEARQYNQGYPDGIIEANAAIQRLKPESQRVDFDGAVGSLAERDLVMINEAHFTEAHRKHQIMLLRGLAESGRPIRVGMELFDKRFNYELSRFMNEEGIGGNYMKQRISAESTPARGWYFGELFDWHRPLLDEMKRLRGEGHDIELKGLERGYTEQQIFRGDDFYGRDKHMAEQVREWMKKDREGGVADALYVTITGAGHGTPPEHLRGWMPDELRDNCAAVVLGDLPAGLRLDGMIDRFRGRGRDPVLQGRLRESNIFYLEGEGRVYDLSREKQD